MDDLKTIFISVFLKLFLIKKKVINILKQTLLRGLLKTVEMGLLHYMSQNLKVASQNLFK